MKFSLKVSTLVLGSVVAIGASSVAHAQADSTGVIPLVGVPTIREAMVPSSGGRDRAWTSLFIGQQKCKSAPPPWYSSLIFCATVTPTGAVRVTHSTYINIQTPVPDGINTVAAAYGGGDARCRYTYNVQAFPTGHNNLTGTNPTDWNFTHSRTALTCSGGR